MKFMPKPGAWMETFERAMGFILMGTVIYFLYILYGQVGGEALLATITFLLGVAFAVWLITVFSDPMRDNPRPLVGWVVGLAVAAGTHWLAYTKLWPTQRLSLVAVQAPAAPKPEVVVAAAGSGRLPWIPYSRNRLAQLVTAGKTVHIDFTADWCPNCKYVEATALNTQETRKVVDELGVINMKADWTDTESDTGKDIAELLAALKSGSIPVQAIFPAGDLYHPIVIRDIFTGDTFTAELRRAGPSKDATAAK
jgi:thiol:disulfide interchange protein